jgi:hypothetical protein
MEAGMKTLALFFLAFSAAALAQTAIPEGTILPAQLNSSLNSAKNKSGQAISARVMQDVPLSSGQKIKAGAKLVGRVVSVEGGRTGVPAQIAIRFDTLKVGNKTFPVLTSLRALASMAEVENAQVPDAGPDRGTPGAWTTHDLIGGEVAYGEGPVARGDEIIGKSLVGGVLVPLKANRAGNCRGELGGNSRPQATWIFASDACGLYGFGDMRLSHAGRTSPVGEIVLLAPNGKIVLRSGSGLLLRVNGSR